MSIHEVTTHTIITTVKGEVKAISFTQPLHRFLVETLPNDQDETIRNAADKFHQEVANTFHLMATRMYVYKNVTGIEHLTRILEQLFLDNDTDEDEVIGIINRIQSTMVVGTTDNFY